MNSKSPVQYDRAFFKLKIRKNYKLSDDLIAVRNCSASTGLIVITFIGSSRPESNIGAKRCEFLQ